MKRSFALKVQRQTHKWTHRNQNTNFPLHTKGVNVKCCFYLIIINLKDYLTWQAADEVLISSLMFPLSPSLTSSSVFLLLFSFQNVFVTHFLTFRNCRFHFCPCLSFYLFQSVVAFTYRKCAVQTSLFATWLCVCISVCLSHHWSATH